MHHGPTNNNNDYLVKMKPVCLPHCVTTLKQALQLFIDICGALVSIHDKKLLHRDVRMSNVLFDSLNQRYLLTDFDHGGEDNGSPISIRISDFSSHFDDIHGEFKTKNGGAVFDQFVDMYLFIKLIWEFYCEKSFASNKFDMISIDHKAINSHPHSKVIRQALMTFIVDKCTVLKATQTQFLSLNAIRDNNFTAKNILKILKKMYVYYIASFLLSIFCN